MSEEAMVLDARYGGLAAIVPDAFRHEQAACFKAKGKGIVVMISRGYRGVVNSVRSAIKASGISKVHAVHGGFHLMPTECARETAAALEERNPDYLIPRHCTGTPFYEVAKREMPRKVLLGSKGTRFVFWGLSDRVYVCSSAIADAGRSPCVGRQTGR